MKRVLLIAMALATTLAPICANAETARFGNGRYVEARRCIAYSEIPQLQIAPETVAGLREAIGVDSRSGATMNDAHDSIVQVRDRARQLVQTGAGLQRLRDERNAACSSFVPQGFVQLETATPAS